MLSPVLISKLDLGFIVFMYASQSTMDCLGNNEWAAYLTCTGWTRNIVAWNAGSANSSTAARSANHCTCWNTQKDTNSAFVRKINIYKYQMYQCIMLEINLKLCLLWLFAQWCTICLVLWFFWIQCGQTPCLFETTYNYFNLHVPYSRLTLYNQFKLLAIISSFMHLFWASYSYVMLHIPLLSFLQLFQGTCTF